MVTLSTKIVCKKSTQYRKYLWSTAMAKIQFFEVHYSFSTFYWVLFDIHTKNIQNLSKKWYEFKFNFKKKSLHCAKDEREGPSRVLIRESLLK